LSVAERLKKISRKGAKAQRKTACLLCAFAPLRELLSSKFQTESPPSAQDA
jgi:hypothetical protein